MSTNSNKCPNCGAPVSCTCKLRTASDGKKVCTSCIIKYEADLNLIKNIPQSPSTN